jgi:hypothetical protein
MHGEGGRVKSPSLREWFGLARRLVMALEGISLAQEETIHIICECGHYGVAHNGDRCGYISCACTKTQMDVFSIVTHDRAHRYIRLNEEHRKMKE